MLNFDILNFEYNIIAFTYLEFKNIKNYTFQFAINYSL